MRLTVLYDNHSGFRKGLLGAHGFSALIELGGIKVLVDTGTEGEILLNNMRALGVSPEDVDYVFITHGHYDHTGGLKTFLEVREKPIKVIAHPEIFRRRIALKPRRREIGIPFTREELDAELRVDESERLVDELLEKVFGSTFTRLQSPLDACSRKSTFLTQPDTDLSVAHSLQANR